MREGNEVARRGSSEHWKTVVDYRLGDGDGWRTVFHSRWGR